MTTRLDRLFLLLDTGSTPLIRKSAAEQLGEVQKLHPYELNNLLSKVHVYLRSSNWDTRIAAGQAVEAIAKNVPQWEPRGAPKSEAGTAAAQCAGKILFTQFDVNKVLAFGASLLGSEGGQYDVVQSAIALDDKERLSQQRQLLNKRLGLDLAGNLGIESDNLFNDEDLHIENFNGQVSGQPAFNKPVADLVKQQLMDVTRGLSARERNRAKRKAKHLAKQISKDGSSESSAADLDPPAKKTKQDPENNGTSSDKTLIDTGDNTLNLEEMDEWPFETFCEVLMNDLFNSSWEIRHGAATGLREVIKQHGRGASKSSDTPSDQMTAVNQIWLSDLSLRLLCVLVLDRFGDFVSDEVVAPVRETCSQNLGVALKFLDVEGVQGVTSVLLQLLSQSQWEVRHGGLLGIKYLLAVRQDLTDALLPIVLPAVFRGLQDPDDDVRAVAAAALIPVSDKLVLLMPQQTPVVIDCLWQTLLDLDDLTASTNSIMILLSTLLSKPSTTTTSTSQALSELTPRLWPFFRHNILSVRKAALETFYTLLNIPDQQQPVSQWLTPILSDALRHIYQRSLLENDVDVLNLVQKVWSVLLEKAQLDYLIVASVPWLGVWLCLLMQPSRTPFEPTYLLEAKHKVREQTVGKRCPSDSGPILDKDNREYIGGAQSLNKTIVERDIDVMRSRIAGTKLLGLLAGYITKPVPNYPKDAEKPVDSLRKLFIFHLNTKSALQRYVIGQVLYQWALLNKNCDCPEDVKTKLLECLSEAIYFDEIALAFTRMQSDCRDFIASLKQQGVEMDSLFPPASILSLDQAGQLTSTVFDQVKISLKPKVLQMLDDRRKQLQITVTQTTLEQQTLTVRVLSSLAMAAVVLSVFPEKLNPVVRPLMDCIKKEDNRNIQAEAAKSLARMIEFVLEKNPNPISKIIKNLCNFLCCDSSYTPLVHQPIAVKTTENQPHEVTCDINTGILTLSNLQKAPEKNRKWLRRSLSIKSADVDVPSELLQEDSEVQQMLKIQRRGADVALSTICAYFSDKMQTKVPVLWECCINQLLTVQDTNKNSDDENLSQELVNSLQVLETVSSSFHSTVLAQVIAKLPLLSVCLQHKYTAVRHIAARCIATLCQLQTHHTMHFIIETIIPMLASTDSEIKRQGASEALANIIELLGIDILPYIVLLVVPILGCMCDQNEAVRLMATHCFANMIRLLPLEAGIPDPPEMNAEMIERKEKQREFLEQLLDGSKIECYKITVDIKAELRKYQQDGVNWLGFLNKYKLHGILCDDMGLGKTLQSICILATDHYHRDTKHKVSSIYFYSVSSQMDQLQKKLSRAVKQLTCNHRLILSGTPIQNNVLDLWSLFDFLMPGFLGTEKQFQARYGKPIIQSRDAKSTTKDQEAGALAMEALHRQVLPFVLRRLKEDVLQDLPPKIIQDYYCDLSPLQVELYEDFARSRARNDIDETVTSQDGKEKKSQAPTHIFQTIIK
ncbi:TATA-binding protein-associated factor 172 [Patella vulgata]|uniref:TATA-binding protein-associated factor 172 n=1 Tax=Patella vulgata TaxID=6465 RepID=UPI00217FBBE6|nr:TATA-binding protein-associated factor 172 [Patella vulgata]